MIQCDKFYQLLSNKGIDFFTGVPDSLLKDFCAYITDHTPSDRHITAANEGGAIALATGYHLATEKIGVVYMQNSGQGNAINPLTSLADKDVYSIPMLLLIGWRGEPNKKDEPQHVKQGEITLGLLDILGIEYTILPESIEEVKNCINKAIKVINERTVPYALVVRKGIFEPYELQNKIKTNYELDREAAIRLVTHQLSPHDVVISTTGKTSRELFEYREALGQGHSRDFLTVGSMGHASKIALGVALAKPNRNVYCFDGDGAFIMHMGSLGIIGSCAPKNFKHIVFNNGAHDSVGGQPTVGFDINIPMIAKACGYKEAWQAITSEEISEKLRLLKVSQGPSLLEIKVNKGARKDLGRPTTTPVENKESFMENLKS